MTVIAGLTDGKTTWLGADSAACDSTGLNWPANDKLLRIKVEDFGGAQALLAFSGNGRLKGLMRDRLVLPTPRPADPNGWAREAARAIQELTLDARPPIVCEDDTFDGLALLGFQGGLWRIAGDTAIPIERSAAIGSGGDIAHGALRAMDLDGPHLPSRRIVENALTIACEDQSDCSLPIDIDST